MKKNEQLQAIVGQYQEAGLKWPATMREVAEWAIKTNKWIPHPSAIVSQCAEELSSAMRDEYVRDSKVERFAQNMPQHIRTGPSKRYYGMIYEPLVMST